MVGLEMEFMIVFWVSLFYSCEIVGKGFLGVIIGILGLRIGCIWLNFL